MIPFESVCVDLIGPWTINIQNQEITFNALTMIDPDTNLMDACCINNKTAQHVATKFEDTWVAHYPRPTRYIHDQGGESTGYHFLQMLKANGILSQPITIKNPQGNAICKRMHQTMASQLRSILHLNPPVNANQIIDSAIASTIFAFHSTIHTT